MKIKKLKTRQEFLRALEKSKEAKDLLTSFPLDDDIKFRWQRAENKLLEDLKKYESLVWYARSDSSKLLQEEIYEGLAAQKRIEKEYPQEVYQLNNDNENWTHGFNSGVLAAIRLTMGLMSKEFIEHDELELYEDEVENDLYITEDGLAGFIYEGWEDAIDNFPELDT